MKAIITSYKAGQYDETAKEVMTKDFLEFVKWVMRAGRRYYDACQDDQTGTLYIVSDKPYHNQFEVRFEEE